MSDLSPSPVQTQKAFTAAPTLPAGASGVSSVEANKENGKSGANKSAIGDNTAGGSPLNSVEAFESYCSQVQTRLAEHAAQRAHFLQAAFERLTRLLHTARSVEDTALYNELWQHRVAVRELLEALHQISATSNASAVPAAAPASASSAVVTSSAPPAPAPSPAVSAAPATALPPVSPVGPADSAGSPLSGSTLSGTNGVAPPALNGASNTASASAPVLNAPQTPVKAPPPQGASGLNGHVSRSEPTADSAKDSLAVKVSPPSPVKDTSPSSVVSGQTPAPTPASYNTELAEDARAEYAPRPLRHAVRPVAEITADAMRLRESLRGWEKRHPLRSAPSDNNSIEGLNVPNCLRLRAVACRMRRLEEEGGDTEIAEVIELARDIEDILDDAGDEEYTVALDYDIEPLPTAYQWGELAERYEETARAEEAFEWWITHRSLLNVADVQNLAESVAAIQQRFNRLLFRIGARDPFQQQLFDDLRIWAKDAQCYLYSLRPKVPIQELIEKAQTIDEAWEQARIPVRAVEERQQAVEDVVGMVAESRFGEREQEDEQRLQTALLHCKELKIPFSDRRLRDALLPWAAFLEGDDRFKELSREINLEWERRQEAGKVEVVEDEPQGAMDELKQELEAVRLVTRGKRCLLLGGTCREENRRKIEEALQLSELVWPSTKPSDPLAKFDTELRHSDIVALLTRFSRKEWKNAQDICARDGKKFVHLTTGYGVAQVVRHFYTQIAPRDAAH